MIGTASLRILGLQKVERCLAARLACEGNRLLSNVEELRQRGELGAASLDRGNNIGFLHHVRNDPKRIIIEPRYPDF